MSNIEIEIGDRVQAGQGEDHDTGRVLDTVEAGKVYDDDGLSVLAREPMALIGWDSLVQTWHPVSRLSLED